LINHKTKRINAFTLAEVLITIGLLGVIAMLLIPTLMNIPPSKNKIMFKKVYYSLNEALNEMVNSDVNYPAEETITLAIDGNEYQRDFNYTTGTTNGASNKFCYFLTQIYATINTVKCPTTSDGPAYGTFTTIDGVYMSVFNPVADTANASITSATQANTAAYEFPIDSNLYTTKILVDVNNDKLPNCTLDTQGNNYTFALGGTTTLNYDVKCTDPDRFVIGVRYDGVLQIGQNDPNAVDIISKTSNFSKK